MTFCSTKIKVGINPHKITVSYHIAEIVLKDFAFTYTYIYIMKYLKSNFSIL